MTVRTDEQMRTYLEEQGYAAVRKLSDGRWIGVLKYFYTAGICVGLDDYGFQYRYCYAKVMDAVVAALSWEGENDPPGPWIKLKGHRERGDVMGPGWKET